MVISSLPFIKKKQVKQEDLLKKQKEFKLNNDNTNKVKLISAQDEALLSRIALIKQAKKRINMSYYHINTDHKSAQIFIAALIQAANSGVEVNIIVDAKFSGISTEFVRLLSNQKNIKLYFYNPINLRKPESLQVSLHTKFMLIDNRWIISGGRNISDAFLCEPSKNRVISYDLDVLIKLKEKSQLMIDFNNLFKELIESNETKLQYKEINNKTKTIKQQTKNNYQAFLYEHQLEIDEYLKNVSETLITVESINLIHSSIEARNKQPLVGQTLFTLAQESSDQLTILTPYVIGDKIIVDALKELNDSKEVTLLTNSLASSPNYPAFSNYLRHRRKFLHTNITIYEYAKNNNTSIHSKAYQLSNDLCAIGSMNLDNRSLFINLEQMLIIKSTQFNQKLSKVIRHQINNSNKLEKDLKTYQKTNEKAVPLKKKLLMKITGIILRPFQIFL